MTRCDMLKRLHAAGATLRVEGNRLCYRAPAGALTPDLHAALIEHKPDLLFEYNERAGILEYDAGIRRLEAEARAADMIFDAKHEVPV